MKPFSRTRLLALILLSEMLLAAVLLSPKIAPTVRARDNASTKPAPVLRAAPIPAIQIPPKEIFIIVEDHALGNPGALNKWQEKVFRGKTDYRVARDGERTYLKATSDKTSSGLYLKNLNHKPARDLYLEWEWRAVSFPKKINKTRLSNREEDDFVARIYVVFPGSNFLNSNVLEYIWDERLPVGTVESSPFSGRVKLFVIRSGPADPSVDGGWRVERRNIYEDYRKFFGEEQKRSLGAIGFMSDSDNTKTASEAHFRNLTLKRKKIEPKKSGLIKGSM